jgi:hypothetical protein
MITGGVKLGARRRSHQEMAKVQIGAWRKQEAVQVIRDDRGGQPRSKVGDEIEQGNEKRVYQD